MHKFFCLAVALFPLFSLAQVGIGTPAPETSAQLEVKSTTKGFLPPRMTSAQRTAIASPTVGLMVYQTDGTAGLYYYDGSSWIYIINSTTSTLPVANGGTGATTAAGARTNLGATTVGSNLFTLPDQTDIRFPRINANNTVSTLTDAEFRTAIGAGTSSTTGTVTSVETGSGLTGGTITGTGTISLANGTAAGQVFVTGASPFTPALQSISGDAALSSTGVLTITNGAVALGTDVSGTLPIANGGTGQTTASAAINSLLPSQTGNTNKVLVTDGSNPYWATNVALTSAVVGTLSETTGNIGPNSSTGSYIDLPAGKWSVQVTMMATVSDKYVQGNYWVRTFFSAVTDDNTVTTDCFGPTLVSALIQGGNTSTNKFNMLSGTLIIHNTSGATKRYWYRTGRFEVYDNGSTSMTLENFGKKIWGENSIVAYPMN